MKRLLLALIFLPVLVALVLLLTQMRWKWSQPRSQPAPASEGIATNVTRLETSSATLKFPGQTGELLGATILRGYADTNFPPENDLTLMSRLMENSLLLLKAAANRPLSANEDWADLFRGRNGTHEELLPAQHVALNAQEQLIDRWQTPLFFHALGGGRYEIRSAGPDKLMWTADDLQRNANGSFLRGTNVMNHAER